MNGHFRNSFLDETIWREIHGIVDLMRDTLTKTIDDPSRKTVPAGKADELFEQWQTIFAQAGEHSHSELLTKAIEQSISLHNPRNVGHQIGVPVPLAAAWEFVSALLNNSSAVYEVGQVESVMERILIRWISGLAGYDQDDAGGYFTNGGTIGNLTALLAARQTTVPGNVWKNGVDGSKPAVLVSEQSHYCIKRAAQIMGLGGDAVFPVACDTDFSVTEEGLQEAYETAVQHGYKPFVAVANACSTATGSFDPLTTVAEFCREKELWFHVDGAHGFAVALSGKHRSLLSGIERADSFVWDLHKMMMMPALTTAVVFRENRTSYAAFAQDASYLFDEEEGEPWYDLAHRTLECTKSMIAFKVFMALQLYGEDFFSDYIDQIFASTATFIELLNEAEDFELCTEPQFNILCYRYNPGSRSEAELNQLQKRIRKALLQDGTYYIVQTKIGDRWYLRSTIVNPLTGREEYLQLLGQIREVADNL